MSIPDQFSGKITLKIEEKDFDVWFYRRTDPNYKTVEEFVESINFNNFGWDEPSRQLFYKDSSGQLYKVNFELLSNFTQT